MTNAAIAALEEYANPRNWTRTPEGLVFIDDAEPWGQGGRRTGEGEGQRNMNWFNASAPTMKLGRLHIRLWNIFNRRSTQGHWWGAGLLQVGKRHLFYVGYQGVYALFLRPTP